MPLDTLDSARAQEILTQLALGLPPRGAALELLVGLEDTMAVLRDHYLRGLLKRGGSTVKVVLGGYGCGKTHLFYALEELGQREGYASSFVELHFEETPIESFGRVYRAVAEGLTLPTGERGLRPALDRFAERVLSSPGPSASASPRTARERFVATESALPPWETYREELWRWVEAASRGGDAEMESRVIRNLTLDKGSVFGEAEAFRLLAALTRFVRGGLGLSGLLIFVDETEERSILERPATLKAKKAATNLVEIVNKSHDRTFEGCLIFLSFPWTPAQLEEKLRPFPPLLGRLGQVAPLGARDRFGVHIMVGPPESDEALFHFLRGVARKVADVHARLVEGVPAPLTSDVLALCERFATSVSPERTRRFVKELVQVLEREQTGGAESETAVERHEEPGPPDLGEDDDAGHA